jgi:ELWxxDGT repeat protein
MPRHPSWRSIVGVGLFVSAGAFTLSAQPHLVADLNRQRVDARSPRPAAGVEHEGVLYFPAHDPQHGYELWRTDGTPDGTYRLVDLCPGRCSGEDAYATVLGFFHGFLYFLGDDSEHGTAIWRTDGTVGGEEMLADCPGDCESLAYSWVEWRGALWFLAQETFDASPVLWTSDGTPEGTRPAASLCADLSICLPDRPNFYVSLTGPDPSGQGLLVWTIGYGLESLFRTDGTAGGTALLHHFVEGSQFIDQIQRKATGGPLYFLDNAELWTSDGTPAGTRLVRSLVGLVDDYDMQSFEVVDGIFYATFFAYNQWLRSDGTAEGTFVLTQVGSFSDLKVAHIGSAVFVVSSDGVWRTEGTPETTTSWAGPVGLVLDVVEGPDRLFVLGFEPEQHRPFLWTTDGTPAGTRKIHFDGGPTPEQDGMKAFGGGVLLSRGRHELWRIDGAGTQVERLHDFQPANGGSGPLDQVVSGGRLVFFALADKWRARLFSSDGTSAGTSAITTSADMGTSDLGLDFDYRALFKLTRAGGKVLFNSRFRLWETDGSREGTRRYRPQSSFFHSFTLNAPIGFVGGRFVYSATLLRIDDDPERCSGDDEPWVSEGAHGTRQLLDLNPYFYESQNGFCTAGYVPSSPGRGVVVGSIALFAADDLVHGRELFATDGTREGTRLVADVNRKRKRFFDQYLKPQPPRFVTESSDPTDLVRAGSRVFFVANDGLSGRELWVTNGTFQGTRRVADLVPGPAGSTPRNLVAISDAIYFFAANAADGAGEGLYRSDGTPGGTVLVSDLAGVSQARDLLAAENGRLFFVAFTEDAGTELWTSQGTAATTRQVADLRPGSRGSAPQNLKIVGDRVLFAADDGIAGLEPWTSDGTSEGTVRRGDLSPGRDASTPGPFSIANGQILFGADDGEHGRELWAIPLADLHD